MARAPDTLKPYQPTLRNRISTALLGDAKASSVRGRFVKGLMGDTGLSATGLGIVDLLPFLQADEAGRQLATKGQRGAGATNLALSVIPIPAVANKLVKPVVKKATKGVARLIGDVVGEAVPTVSKIADAMEGAAPIKATTPLDAIMDRAKAQGVDLYVSQGNDGLRLSKIVVPKDQRGQGVGSAVMGDLLDYADTTGQRVTLTPSDAFGGSVPRLKKFYGAHDFTPNAGRTRDFSTQDTMIRNPKPKAPIPVPVVQPKITAYHGSPHDFDQFSLDKVGTGEGAQVYGHGLYFAENEGVAQSYRDALGPKPYIHNGLADGAWDDPTFRAATAIHANKGEDGALAVLRGNAQSPRNDATINAILDGSYKKHEMPTGSMYQVGINADPEHFLDWDKPLSQQAPNVQQAVANVANLRGESGGYIWDSLVKQKNAEGAFGEHIADPNPAIKTGPKAATEALREAGVPGIKYLDAGSRYSSETQRLIDGAGSRVGAMDVAKKRLEQASTTSDRAYWQKAVDELAKPETRNFVVFDEKLITILKKYGWVPGAALPAAAIAEYTKENGSPPPTVPMV